MSLRLVDAHCHISFDAYDTDRDTLLARMRDMRIGGIVVGVDRESSRRALALARNHPFLCSTIGLHPNYTEKEEFVPEFFEKLGEEERVVGIGECGLDYYRPLEVTEALKEKQKEVFRKHIRLGAHLRKPLMIHARPSKGTMDAYHDVIVLLEEGKREYGDVVRGNIHFFVGGIEEADAFMRLGFTMSYTAVITFARDYDNVIKHIGEDFLLAETDAPYVAPKVRRGERNDPLSVIDVAEELARIREVEVSSLEETLRRNTNRVFGFPVLGEYGKR